MEATLIFGSSIIILAIIIISLGIKIVPQSDVYVVERLGKFRTTLHGGLNFIIPVIDNVRSKLTTREQLVDIPRQPVITKDNVNINIDGIVFCKVDDAKEATYNIVDFKRAISNLAMTTLRGEIGGMNLDDTLSNRESLNIKLQRDLGAAALNWGIKIVRVEISEISVPKEIESAMNKQMIAERDKRAIELEAQAKKEAVIRNAEAMKQEKVLEAEAIERMADAKKYEQEKIADGQKMAMELINTAMQQNRDASEFLLAKDRIDAFKSLAQSDSKDKIILPYNVAEMIGSMSVMGEAWFTGMKNGTNS
jgi:regulator of protease activity HflC (stomatin/prohibitin superfamily)